MNGTRSRKVLAAATTSSVVLVMTAVTCGIAMAAATTFVSPSGRSGHAGTSCATAKYSSIQQAVRATPSGGTVVVCHGTYTMAGQKVAAGKPFLRVNKAITVRGQSLPLLDATGATPATGAGVGVLVTASHATVSGLKVVGAVNEGIVAEPLGALLSGAPEVPAKPLAPIQDVTVTRNVVTGDNKGFAADFCQNPKTEYPDDCGGGIHFNAVAHSTMSFNTVTHNADGILVTDDAGPTHHNVIKGNRVLDNTIECGITLPSHSNKGATFRANPDGTFSVTGLAPAKGGVYDNVITGNTSNGNGTHGFQGGGSGAGVLLAGAGPGTAVYGNVITGNHLSGNGLAGVTVHAHYPGGEFLNGNSIVGNVIGKNSVLGDTLDGPPMVADRHTTGILVFTAPRTTWKVSGNTITGDAIGIWHNTAATIRGSNTFRHVTRRVVMPRVPFGTAACGPDFAPCATTSTTADVQGLVVANGSWTAYYWRYGTSPTNLPTNTPSLGAGSRVVAIGVRATLTGLAPATKYYYQLVTLNRYGRHAGLTESFTTTT